jgi:heparan-alpha-glucosaminide N-acetyltransferase
MEAINRPLPPQRLASIDAYRGFVMLLMMGEVLRFRQVAERLPDSKLWKFLAYHQTHVEWVGCSLHDLIQPSFSFLVGVALPFSLAGRIARGQSWLAMTWHALWRAVALVFLGVFLRSMGRAQTNFTFEDTLSQIGLGYFFLFLLGSRPRRDQGIALVLILVGYWALFAFYPKPGSDFDYTAVGVKPGGPQILTGFAAHWNMNSNPAWAFDRWFLNLFPRKHPWKFNGGGYSTLNFIPTLGTMVLGLLAGDVLKSDRPAWRKIVWLVMVGLISLSLGWALGAAGICPVVKKIWTPSWVLFSGGWCFLLLAGFYVVLDLLSWRLWAFPLIVVGMNSIAAYCLAHGIDDFVARSLKTHLGHEVFLRFGEPYAPAVEGAAVLLVLWLILYWMYRRRIFLRI